MNIKSIQQLFIVSLLLLLSTVTAAQPATVKNAAKSVFKLTTYNSDGSIMGESHGVFIGSGDECISNLQPLVGAACATVTDVKGNTMNVSRIIGINELYDAARFKIDGKGTPLQVAKTAANSGSQIWLVPYSAKQNAISATVKNVEKFMGDNSYYIFSITPPADSDACPFIDASGCVIGLMQRSTTSSDIHAADARFYAGLQASGFNVNDATMRKIGIPMALPSVKEQALLALMMTEQSGDSLKKTAAISDFINSFPDVTDGYMAHARMMVSSHDFDKAAKDMETAIKKVTKKDEAHFGYSRIIHDKEIYMSDMPYKAWSLDKALDEAVQAYNINPHPSYKEQQAKVLFSLGRYDEAYNIFETLTSSSIRNPELFYEAARCKQMMNSPAKETIALLDSAIVNTDSLRIREAAPYYLLRGQMYYETDSFRQAVFDYTRYEILSNRNVNAEFYYMRHQAEVKGRLYKQALYDITAAIVLNPKEPTYYAEKGSLELKVNMPDEAIKTAELCIKTAPEYPSGYLILGLAQISKGNKTEGLSNLNKAKELGDTQAQALIDKYSK
ncbi:MAG: hypothetical protein ACI4V5_04975 [Prevotella sp.]